LQVLLIHLWATLLVLMHLHVKAPELFLFFIQSSIQVF
jgi:hypothetical protein